MTHEPGPTEHKNPVIAINDRGLILGQDQAGRWILWDQHNTVWPAADRLTWLLPLLERPAEDVVQATATAETDQQLLPALLRFALTSASRHWADLALGWLEAGYPLTDLVDALRELRDTQGQPQPLRHRALRLWRKGTALKNTTTQ